MTAARIPLRVAGVDEAGRGPWAGPVVAAAVIIERRDLPVRIDDSKRLSARQRALAFDCIVRFAQVGVGIVDADRIDTLNILQASLEAMRLAVRDLPFPPDLLRVDGTHVPRVDIPAQAIIGGDHLDYAISCASIVAKVVRDDLMEFYDTVFPGYGFAAHKGYGTPLHRQRLSDFGPCALHRASFAPVAAAVANRGSGDAKTLSRNDTSLEA